MFTQLGAEKNLEAKFTGESCKCTPRQSAPPRQSKSSLFRKLGDLDGGRGYLGSVNVCFDSDY